MRGTALGIRARRLYAAWHKKPRNLKEAPLNPKLRSLLEIVPERFARVPSGVHFMPQSCATRYPERLVHIASKLSWLTPLNSLAVEDLRILGLVNAAGRPVHSADLEEDAEGGLLEPDDAPQAESVEYAAA